MTFFWVCVGVSVAAAISWVVYELCRAAAICDRELEEYVPQGWRSTLTQSRSLPEEQERVWVCPYDQEQDA